MREPVGAGLLLRDAPLSPATALPVEKLRNECRPLDPGVDRHRALIGIEAANAVHRAKVDQQRVGAELLASHRMTAAAQGNRDPFLSRRPDRRLDVERGTGLRTRRTRVSFNWEWMSLTTTGGCACAPRRNGGAISARQRRGTRGATTSDPDGPCFTYRAVISQPDARRVTRIHTLTAGRYPAENPGGNPSMNVPLVSPDDQKVTFVELFFDLVFVYS